MPELTSLYLAFSDLEPLLEKSRSGYFSTVSRAKAAVYAALPDHLKRRLHVASLGGGKEAFARLVEEAEKYPGVQDYYLVSAIKAGAGEVESERLERLIPKLSNRELRQPLLDYINYAQAGRLLTDGRWREAVLLAGKIEQPECRALRLLETAFSISGRSANEAAELLDLAALWAAKAVNSNEKAVLQFSIAGLSAKLDKQRALDVTIEATATINGLIEPDLSVTSYVQRLSAGGFETSLSYTFTSFSLEEIFGLLSEFDFDQAQATADRIDDRSLRARTMLTISSRCLKKAEEKLAQEKRKKSVAEARQK